MVVEDEGLVAEDLRETLEAMGHRVAAVTDRGDHALLMAEELRPDVVLVDVRIRGPLDGVQVAEELVGRLDIPAVFVTANADLPTLDRATRARPYGFVLKPFNERELRAAVAVAVYRHQAERRVRSMETWLSTTLHSIGDAVIATDRDGRVSFMNVIAEFLTGWPCAEALGRPLEEVFDVSTPGERAVITSAVQKVLRDGVVFHLMGDYLLRTRAGRSLPIDDSIAPIRADEGPVEGVVVIFRDRTETLRAAEARDEMERRLRDAQRLESLGRLAGGVAHDFNNLLAAIAGYASLEREGATEGSDLAESLDTITEAAQRGADLCAQLLTYAGRGRGSPEPVLLRAFVAASARLLRVSIPKQIMLSMDLGDDSREVSVDPGQLQQVVMNLVLNAADALKGQQGVITLRTGCERLDGAALQRVRVGGDAPPGEYAFLEVSDTGPGIPPEVLPRIFEPFFTTRGGGRGLGLSTVLGVVLAHGGALTLRSEKDLGTTFRVYFPARGTTVVPPPPRAPSGGWRGAGRILLVDDEDAVRRVAQRILERLGFEVVPACDGEEAVALFLAAPEDFRALVSDIAMPRRNGIDAAKTMRSIRADLPVLLMSGFSAREVPTTFPGAAPFARMAKPFVADTLRDALRELLSDAAATPSVSPPERRG